MFGINKHTFSLTAASSSVNNSSFTHKIFPFSNTFLPPVSRHHWLQNNKTASTNLKYKTFWKILYDSLNRKRHR